MAENPFLIPRLPLDAWARQADCGTPRFARAPKLSPTRSWNTTLGHPKGPWDNPYLRRMHTEANQTGHWVGDAHMTPRRSDSRGLPSQYRELPTTGKLPVTRYRRLQFITPVCPADQKNSLAPSWIIRPGLALRTYPKFAGSA